MGRATNRVISKIAFFSIVLFAYFARGDVLKEHKLTVAANPALGLTNQKIDQIISEMNQVVSEQSYPWAADCAPMDFVRVGDLIQDSRLPTSGSSRDQMAALKQYAPTANVLVVLKINCDGVDAAGCSPVGKEPMVVIPYDGFDGQLWLHERGHNTGLQHSGEYPLQEDNVPENIGKRVMFWQLGVGHTGIISTECGSYRNAKLGTIVAISAGPSPAAHGAAAPRPLAAAQISQNLPPPKTAAPAPPASPTLEEMAKKAGLTPHAFQIIGPPWVHGIPVVSVKSLTSDDLQSIRTMLRGDPNQYWAQAMNALSLVGNGEDVELIKNALDLQLPAVAPNAPLAASDQFRNILRAKLAAPQALGVLANRTKSSTAVAKLVETAKMQSATNLVGEGAAGDLSKEALKGLALANTPASKSALQTILVSDSVTTPKKETPSVFTQFQFGDGLTAPLTATDVQNLKKLSTKIQHVDIETAIIPDLSNR